MEGFDWSGSKCRGKGRDTAGLISSLARGSLGNSDGGLGTPEEILKEANFGVVPGANWVVVVNFGKFTI